MPSIEESVEVEVPVSAAYNQWTQFESFPEFMTGVESVIQTDDTHMSAKVMVQLDWDGEGLVEKVAAALGADDVQVKVDLRRFKQLIEDKGGAAGWRGEVPRT